MIDLTCARLKIQRDFRHRRSRIAARGHRRGARVAGHADHFADITHAAVDRRDHTQRQMPCVQNRPLLDVDFDKAEVGSRLANQCVDRFQRGRQSRVLHRLTH